MSSEGPYVAGQKHGIWTESEVFSGVWKGICVEGKKHGCWVKRASDDHIVERGSYVADQRDGTWTINPGRKNERSITYDRSQVDLIRPEMVEILGGSFRMGCVSGRDCDDDEHPVHEVRVESFELGKTEVTFEEYDRFTAATGREAAADEGPAEVEEDQRSLAGIAVHDGQGRADYRSLSARDREHQAIDPARRPQGRRLFHGQTGRVSSSLSSS